MRWGGSIIILEKGYDCPLRPNTGKKSISSFRFTSPTIYHIYIPTTDRSHLLVRIIIIDLSSTTENIHKMYTTTPRAIGLLRLNEYTPPPLG